jgi:hypothetical protein
VRINTYIYIHTHTQIYLIYHYNLVINITYLKHKNTFKDLMIILKLYYYSKFIRKLFNQSIMKHKLFVFNCYTKAK